jgi:hypothetical protein
MDLGAIYGRGRLGSIIKRVASRLDLLDTMVHWRHEVRSLLRPSEHLHLLLVGTAFPNNLPRTHAPNNTLGPSVFLAVVGHMPVGRAVEDSGRSMHFILLFQYSVLNSSRKCIHIQKT